ncbi:MAG: hypothetical protein ACE5IC_05740 [Candidatus Brocadiales bacterium]
MKRLAIPLFLPLIILLFNLCRDVYPEGSSSESAIEREKRMAKKPMAWDLGPDTVDISSYPPYIQSYFEVFKLKCGGCHTLARPLNAPFATPEEWNTYVNKMIRKPGAAINKEQAKQIFQFLVYDSKVRKLSDPDAWERHLQRLIDEFQKEYGKK